MIIVILLSIFSLTTAIMNSAAPHDIDKEIKQEYINAHKMGGYYYKANLEKAEQETRNRTNGTAF